MSFVSPLAEFCSVSVSLSVNETVNIVGFYRPPVNSNIEDFCHLFRDRILSHFSPSQLVITGGDANIDLLSINDRLTNYYMDLMCSFSFIPCISLPSRVTNSTSRIIDHFWSNITSNIKSGVLKTDITDHYTIFLCILDRRTDSPLIRREFRDCSIDNLDRLHMKLNDMLGGFSAYDELDVNLRTRIFLGIFWNAFNECCPIKTKFVSRTRLTKPWFDGDLRQLCCDMKHALFKLYKDEEVPFATYNRFKNKFTSILKRTRNNYFRTQFPISIKSYMMIWN